MNLTDQSQQTDTNRICPFCKEEIFETYMTKSGPVDHTEHDPVYCRRNPDRIIHPHTLRLRKLLLYAVLLLATQLFLVGLNIKGDLDWPWYWIVLTMIMFIITLGFLAFIILTLVWTRDEQ